MNQAILSSVRMESICSLYPNVTLILLSVKQSLTHAYLDMSRIYLVVLAKDTPSPFALTDDQVKLSENKPVVPASKDNSKRYLMHQNLIV